MDDLTTYVLTPEQRNIYIQHCLKRGDAPLKPQCLKCVVSSETNGPGKYQPLLDALGFPDCRTIRPTEDSNALADTETAILSSIGDNSTLNGKKRPAEFGGEGVGNVAKRGMKCFGKQRGQNKDRRSNLRVQLEANTKKLCPIVCQTDDECQRGDECIFEHDRNSFMQNRDPDLGPICENVKQFGVCRFGLNCRFGLSHIKNNYNVNREGNNVTSEMINIESIQWKDINDIQSDIRIALRKKKYCFKHPVQSSQMDEELELKNANDSRATMIDSNYDRKAEIRKKRDEIFCTGKRMLGPLTTVGNLPFRRLCVSLGAEVTMSEMALAQSIVEGKPSELALLKRHQSEKLFGIQLACGRPNILRDCCSFIEDQVSFDFIDLNCACPVELLHKKMCGSVLMDRPKLLYSLVDAMRLSIPSHPITTKMRMSHGDEPNAHSLILKLESLGVDAFLIHGRTSRQRYTKSANWDYLKRCKALCTTSALIGSGDVLSWNEYNEHLAHVDNVLIGRGALIKPWIFTEIKEQRLWDISATERLDFMKQFVSYGLNNWGSDSKGIEVTRRYFLEWCSFTCRYIPVGLLEQLPQRVNWRPPPFIGRNDLETLMGSSNVKDWIRLSEMVLGKPPDNFSFIPKHKSNSYQN